MRYQTKAYCLKDRGKWSEDAIEKWKCWGRHGTAWDHHGVSRVMACAHLPSWQTELCLEELGNVWLWA